MVGRGSFGSGWRWSHTHSRLEQQTVCPVIELGLGLGLLKDNDEDITIFQGNRYPQLRSAKLPLQSESDDLKGGNDARVRSTR